MIAIKKLACISTASLLAGLCLTVSSLAQAPRMLTYDVVSVKPNKSGPGSVMINMGNDSFNGTNVSLKMLMQNAYNLKTQDQIAGLAGPMDSAAFDIAAKMDAETIAYLKTLSKDDAGEQRRLMLRAMLEDRFHLKIHHETREMPVYNMVIAKGGLKLKEAPPPDPVDPDAPKEAPRPGQFPGGRCNGCMMMSKDELKATGIETSGLANLLSSQLHRLVVDKTGLTARYDFTLKFSRDDAPAQSADTTGVEQQPTLIIAVEEQLGLKLDSTKGPVDTIVVDHVEQPSEN